MLRHFVISAVIVLVSTLLVSCAGKRPLNLEDTDYVLMPCPSAPKCVSSTSDDSAHQVAPFQLAASPEKAWQAARELVLQLPRTRIVKESSGYLYAECRSAVFRFVDDLELQLHPSGKFIAVRSSARWGYTDFGVNRRRVEDLRAALISRGVVR